MTATRGRPAPGWHPDPHRRHTLRWWDGTDWSAQVADGEVVASDPVTGPAPARAPRRRAAAVAVAAAALLVAALALVVVTAEPTRPCLTAATTVEGDLARGSFDRWCVRLAAGQALRFRVEPAEGQDVLVAAALPDGVPAAAVRVHPDLGVDRFRDVFAGDLRDAASRDEIGAVGVVADGRAAGEPEAAAVPPLPVDAEVTVVVAGFEGAGGGYTLDVELLDPPAGFDAAALTDARAFAEFVAGAEAHYAPFLEGDFYP